MKIETKGIITAAIIAALYVVLTEVSALFNMSSGVIQLRLSEALYALAWFTPFAIPGLFIGCIISNLLTGAIVWDVIFGSIATLIGGMGTYYFRNNRIISLLCPVVSNAVIVPLVLKYAYGIPGALWYFIITVGVGELISCVVFGYALGKTFGKYKILK